MAWTKFTVENKTPGAGTGLKVALRKAKAGPTNMGLTILEDVGKKLGWSDMDKLEVMVGDGQHHGLLRLRKNNSVGTALVVGKKAIHDSYYLKVGLGHVPGFVDRSEAARWVRFEEAAEGWVEITLPLWAAETAPAGESRGIAVRPAAVAQAAAFERPKRNATSSLMGDPPPARSALAANGKAR
jgi:hypothetical protein